LPAVPTMIGVAGDWAGLRRGGSELALRSSPRGSPWRVGVQEPGAPNGTFVGLRRVRDEGVNTSGLYKQFFVADGKKYAHIRDTRTGYPVANGVDAAVVIRDRLQHADEPSLAFLAPGPRSLGGGVGGEAQGLRENSVILDVDWIRRLKKRKPPSPEKNTDAG